ncbi:S-methyl-5-thioadenosine phosphorylase [Tilletia horrida]|uniref:S-methyl-5'-thioadenosine phosphorylase n=1 Tax=Tilletia horrida TaxID=155126 RepID=A0AAN6JLH6_9BASI|nr:S-methyl-5-thioadenosine phosphorylase [Tilletia horrida]KAK0532827.1 S-methyl-5-thioadenosine phosphorylase [Tilletia horrida]KAK0538901.1 S-methyl-5-thioadenosine phosphorylase [Tilletia horrida]KAK0562059.1 S-methyl-5-thioadenosine phosphorylase [Tilletia horrida]
MVEKLSQWTGEPIRLGVFGGSGLYKLDHIEPVAEINPETPWGFPSSPITIAKTPGGNLVAFLARHGIGHVHSPSHVPFLANIAAFKHLGVRAIVAFSAVGSLREEIRPKDFVVPSQIIDRTKGIRRATFFGEEQEKGVVAHAMFGDPFDEKLRPLVEDAVRKALAEKVPDVKVHGGKAVVCMEGPAFSTRAESLMYRAWGGDIINMSVLPEAKLAREAEIAYALIATATDYDAWRVSDEVVTVAEVIECLKANVAASNLVTLAVLDTIYAAIATDDSEIVKVNKNSMKFSVMTGQDLIPEPVKERLRYILPDIFPKTA